METPYQQRIAVVTGANKGIGLEICRQLSENGVTVVLTARDETRGKAAISKLHYGVKDVIFHQLDVADPMSIASLKEFIQNQFGRLDILVLVEHLCGPEDVGGSFVRLITKYFESDSMVNNAAVSAVELEAEFLKLYDNKEHDLGTLVPVMIQKYEKAIECIDINYYGTKRMCEAFIPLLQLSKSPRIVNLSSNYGLLRIIPSETIKNELRDADNITEERLDEIVRNFLHDFKTNNVKQDTWPSTTSAYKISKVAISTYTRILARKHTELCINCVHPGYVMTDITWNTGDCTAEEGAKGPVMVALLPDCCPSGQFYSQTELSSFE